jgi:FkbM family methyltransferase
MKLKKVFVQGGDVPGGHIVLTDGVKRPEGLFSFCTMRYCHSIELRASDVVVDIGAYVGTYSLWAARSPVAQVVAYEPSPLSQRVLTKNAGNLPNIVVRPEAVVGDCRQWTDFFLSGGLGITNSRVASKAKKPIRVAARSFEEAIRHATVVKIDIEGGEYDLPFSDLPDQLRAMIIEFHSTGHRDWIERAEKIVADVEGQGFRSVLRPNWANGFTRQGSWRREVADPGAGRGLLLDGVACSGCGVTLRPAAGAKAICDSCLPKWLPRHRRGFMIKRDGEWTAS